MAVDEHDVEAPGDELVAERHAHETAADDHDVAGSDSLVPGRTLLER